MKTVGELLNLSGRTAIVTGGAMGIGFGIASRLAEAGAGVLIADMNEKAAQDAAAVLAQKGWKARAFRADVSNASEVEAMVTEAVSAFGSIDILVNNAGIYPTVPVMEEDPALFEKILSVNLKSVFLATKAAAARMIAEGRGGTIINVTSIDALHPSSVGLATYDASKHGVWGFTKNVALELAPHRITVNAIAPGGIRTPGMGVGAAPSPQLEKMMASFIEKIPMKRLGEPDDIGTVALFLASDMARYMTGSQIVVDGGRLLS